MRPLKELVLSFHCNLVLVVQSLSHVWLFVTPGTAAHQASLSFISRSLLKLMSIKSVMPSNHLILCRPLLLLPSVFPSMRVFSNESALQVAKVLAFQLQHQSFQWIFKIDLLQYWLVWSPCLRDSQDSSLSPQFKSINYLVFSLLYGPPCTSIHDYWKNHGFDYMDPCRQSYVSIFKTDFSFYRKTVLIQTDPSKMKS